MTDFQEARRRTGRSTRRALNILLTASNSPGQNIRIQDHHGTRLADQDLSSLVEDLTRGMPDSREWSVFPDASGDWFVRFKRSR